MPSEPTPKTDAPRDGRVAASFAVARTPLLSLSVHDRLAALLGEGVTPERFAADRQRLRAAVDELFADPWVVQAITLGSPGLVESYRAERASAKGVRDATLAAVFSFILRMSGRTTPFGLFAGLSVLEIGARTEVTLAPRERYEAHFRFDMQYLFALERALLRDPATRARLRFVANETIVRRATRLSYVADRLAGESRACTQLTYERSEPLDACLAAAGTGARAQEIAQVLVAEGNDAEDAQAFVEQLIDERLLVPLCRPPVVGRDPALQMADALEADGVTEVAASLRAVVARARALRPGTTDFDAELAATIAARPPVGGQPRVLHADLTKPVVEGVLSRRVVSDIAVCIDVLHRAAGNDPRHDRLGKFTAKFIERYGDRAVPLLEAIDPERGVPVTVGQTAPAPGPLLDGLPFFRSGEGRDPAGVSPRDVWLLERLRQAWSTGAMEIALTDEDFAAMTAPGEPTPLPPTLMATVHLTREHEDAPWNLFFFGATGPSSMRMLGRFAHVDERLAGLIDGELAFEAQAYAPAAVAELIYTPEGRVGNAVVRELRRDFALVVAGSAGEAGTPLDFDKLVLQADAAGRLRLYSTELGREVIPRSTTAHNPLFAGSLIYSFLGFLEREAVASFASWSWGALENSTFLPRVTYRGLVLARARWQLGGTAAGLGAVIQAKTDAEAFSAMAEVRAKHHLPRHIGLVDGENVLPLDLENIMCIDLLRGQKHGAVLSELGARQSVVNGPEGAYAAELQVALRMPGKPMRRPPTPFVPVAKASRRFAPTSSWTYAKIYLPPDEADDVLLDTVAPLLERARREAAIATWFFIRYEDVGQHLRVRWQHTGKPSLALADTLFRALEQHPTASIERLVLDTYDREVERYGGPEAIGAAEQVFGADTAMVMALLAEVQPEADDELRWRFALHALEDMARVLVPDVAQRLEVYRANRAAFVRELRVGGGHEKLLSARTRGLRPELISLMTTSPRPELAAAELALRRERLQAYAAVVPPALRASVTSSVVHMMCNRIFKTDARAQEFVLWDYAARGLDGLRVQLARQGAATGR